MTTTQNEPITQDTDLRAEMDRLEQEMEQFALSDIGDDAGKLGLLLNAYENLERRIQAADSLPTRTTETTG